MNFGLTPSPRVPRVCAGVSGLPAGAHHVYAECLQNGDLEHEVQWVIAANAARDILRLELPALAPGYHTIGIAILRSSPRSRGDAQADDEAPSQLLLAMRKITIEVVEWEPIYDQTAVDFECTATRIFESAGSDESKDVGDVVDRENITLASIASIDRATQILHVTAAWDGPISVAFYARTELEMEALIELVKEVMLPLSHARGQAVKVEILCMCSDKSPTAHPAPAAHQATSGEDASGERPHEHVFGFPINKLRWTAVKNARTHRVLTLDADFLPSNNAHALLKNAYRNAATGPRRLAQEAEEEEGQWDRDFLVMPCFLTSDDSPWPEPAHLRADGPHGVWLERGGELTKAKLRAQYAAGHVKPPGAPFSLHLHGATDYVRWMALPDPHTDADAVTYAVCVCMCIRVCVCVFVGGGGGGGVFF